MQNASSPRQIYSVSELTSEIKALLEENYPFIWIYGEISNFKRPSSGHFYFTLKDQNAQIPAVMFRAQQAGLKFFPEDGMEITGLGRISLYEPRGAYQVILEYMEPRGIGALQKAFEQLKKKLAAEGLFENRHKQPIPFLPAKIALITSSTGAVIHDMLNIIYRRFENIEVQIFPVKVQGDGSAKQIVGALNLLNARADADVAIIARGGGSLEDLQAFNTEAIARAIFASHVPIISAVGHETDFTIADFVADLRAPTPSAAAELVVPVKRDLKARCIELAGAIAIRASRIIQAQRENFGQLQKRLVHPKRKIQDYRLRLDDLTGRLNWLIIHSIKQNRDRVNWRKEKLISYSPLNQMEKLKSRLDKNINNLLYFKNIYLPNKKTKLQATVFRLEALNPTAILARGYSITRTIPSGRIVQDARTVTVGQPLSIILAKGSLVCRVEEK